MRRGPGETTLRKRRPMTALLEPIPRGLSRLRQSWLATSALRREAAQPEPARCSIALGVDGFSGVLTVSGDLDATAIPALLALADRMRWQEPRGRFVIDLRSVTGIDADALGALSNVWRSISSGGGYLVLICEKGPVANGLAGTELHAAMHVQPGAPNAEGLEPTAPPSRPTRPDPAPSLSALRRFGTAVVQAGGLAD